MTQPTFTDGTPYAPPNRHPFIVLEGIDGSGKTTISEKVALHFNCNLSHEPFEIQDYVDNLYSCNPYERALLFAADRAVHCEIIAKCLPHDMYITDRYYYSNLVYQSTIDSVPLPWLYAIQPPNLIHPTHIFLCECDVDIALTRCHKKHEPWTSQQLHDLQESYHDVLKFETHTIIDTSVHSINECVAMCIEKIEVL